MMNLMNITNTYCNDTYRADSRMSYISVDVHFYKNNREIRSTRRKRLKS